MKTLRYLLVLAIVLIAGCTKDSGIMDNQELELKRAKVPIPYKAEGRIVKDPVMPGLYWMNGVASHLGKIDSDQSFYQITSIVPTSIDGEIYLKLGGFGKLVGANGDGMEFTFWSYQHSIYGTYKGQTSIIPESGTGRFKGCTGILDSEGAVDAEGASFLTTGEVVYPEREVKRADVQIPFKAVCRATTDMESDFIYVTIPGSPEMRFRSRLMVSGTGTHIGKIDATKSYYEFSSMEFTLLDGKPYFYLIGSAKLVGANGDGMELSFWTYQSLIDNSWYSEAVVVPGSGTGKFKGCTGTIDTAGGVDDAGIYFTSTGYLVYE
jgi:hypothetical protein